MHSILAQLLSPVRRWVGWEWAVVVIRRGDDVRMLTLPDDLPVSVRSNTDGSVGMTIGREDDGEALLADLRALMGDTSSPLQPKTNRQESSMPDQRDR